MQPTSTYMFGVWGLELERNQTLQFSLTTTTANVAMIALGIFVLQSIKIKHFLELETWGFYIDHKACTMQNPESQGIFLLNLKFQVNYSHSYLNLVVTKRFIQINFYYYIIFPVLWGGKGIYEMSAFIHSVYLWNSLKLIKSFSQWEKHNILLTDQVHVMVHGSINVLLVS